METLLGLVEHQSCNIHGLVQQCFKVRKMIPFGRISRLAEGGQSKSKFRDLRHYIGRLGEHVKSAKILVTAALRMPYLLENFEIRVCRSSRYNPSPLSPTSIDLDGIVGRAFHGENIDRYRASLSSMNRIFEGNLWQLVKDRCSFSTRVHAELLFVNHFQEHQYAFVADDRYIGCSKPACYCCYHYISALRQGFNLSMPACHNNLYLAWRAPDIPQGRGKEALKQQQDALNTMILSIRADLQRQIDGREPRRPSQYDSLTGVTPLHEREIPETGKDEPNLSRNDADREYYFIVQLEDAD